MLNLTNTKILLIVTEVYWNINNTNINKKLNIQQMKYEKILAKYEGEITTGWNLIFGSIL